MVGSTGPSPDRLGVELKKLPAPGTEGRSTGTGGARSPPPSSSSTSTSPGPKAKPVMDTGEGSPKPLSVPSDDANSIEPSISNISLYYRGSGVWFTGKDHFSLFRRIIYDFVRTVPFGSIIWFVMVAVFLAGVRRRLEQFFAEFSLMGLDKLFFAEILEVVVTVIIGINAAVLALTFLTSGVFQETFARRFCRERGFYSTVKAQSLLNVLRAAYLGTYLCIVAILTMGFMAMAMLVIWATISAVCEEVVEAGPALAENRQTIEEALADLKNTGITPEMVGTIFRAVQNFCTGREKTYTSVSSVMFLGVMAPLMQINFCMCAFSNVHHLAHEVERARAEEDGINRARQELERALRAKEVELSVRSSISSAARSSTNPASPLVCGPESPSRVV